MFQSNDGYAGGFAIVPSGVGRAIGRRAQTDEKRKEVVADGAETSKLRMELLPLSILCELYRHIDSYLVHRNSRIRTRTVNMAIV